MTVASVEAIANGVGGPLRFDGLASDGGASNGGVVAVCGDGAECAECADADAAAGADVTDGAVDGSGPIFAARLQVSHPSLPKVTLHNCNIDRCVNISIFSAKVCGVV